MLAQAEAIYQRKQPDFSLKQGEIFPGDNAAVLSRSRTGIQRAFVMRWGFRMEKKLVFNARAETAAKKPMFRDSMMQRRCIVPASGYFEWDHREKKPPKYLFTPESGSMMFMAGLYRPEEDAHAFTILTRDAVEGLKDFHPRMPVILPAEEAMLWLDHALPPERVLSLASANLVWNLA